MGMIDKKPMKYSEIARGNFDKMFQQSFLKAHRLASEYNQKVDVSVVISVFPPDPRIRNSGNLSFSIQLKEPKYVSSKITTALDGGLPINSGNNTAEAEQYSIFDNPVITESDESYDLEVTDEN